MMIWALVRSSSDSKVSIQYQLKRLGFTDTTDPLRYPCLSGAGAGCGQLPLLLPDDSERSGEGK